MRNLFKIVSLQIFVLMINFANASPNHELELGDLCVLNNDDQGTCKEIENCDYAKRLLKNHNNIEIMSYRCKFDKYPLVCCPTISTTEKIEETTVKRPTSGITKYKKALCENETPEVLLQHNIIGGVEAGVGEFPYIAAIGYLKDSKLESLDESNIKYSCGGSLVADDIVITAAHCVHDKKNAPKVVKLGRTSLVPNLHDYSDGDDIEIDYFEIHPNYSSRSKHHDIALMKLKRPYNTSIGLIKPICLSSSEENLPLNFTVAGFGKNDVDKSTTSNWLLKATVNEYPLNKCQEIFLEASLNRTKIIDSQFCAVGYKGADSCQGDSGGPLSYEKQLGGGSLSFLYGVVSTGIGCGSAVPGIYAKVNNYLDWIEGAMNSME